MRIKELHLLTNNLNNTAQFYTQVLGATVKMENEQELSLLLGETLISFQNSPEENPVYHLAFDIPGNKLEEAYHWLKQRTTILPVTAETEFSDFQLWNAKSFYFYDNNGNLLELICRYDLDNDSDLIFDGSSILYVSEIGLVSDDVPFLAETLINKYGLEVYSKQPAQDNFTALGDEEGLLIIVNADRNWFPTEKKAKSFRTKIVFNTGTDEDQELSIA